VARFYPGFGVAAFLLFSAFAESADFERGVLDFGSAFLSARPRVGVVSFVSATVRFALDFGTSAAAAFALAVAAVFFGVTARLVAGAFFSSFVVEREARVAPGFVSFSFAGALAFLAGSIFAAVFRAGDFVVDRFVVELFSGDAFRPDLVGVCVAFLADDLAGVATAFLLADLAGVSAAFFADDLTDFSADLAGVAEAFRPDDLEGLAAALRVEDFADVAAAFLPGDFAGVSTVFLGLVFLAGDFAGVSTVFLGLAFLPEVFFSSNFALSGEGEVFRPRVFAGVSLTALPFSLAGVEARFLEVEDLASLDFPRAARFFVSGVAAFRGVDFGSAFLVRGLGEVRFLGDSGFSSSSSTSIGLTSASCSTSIAAESSGLSSTSISSSLGCSSAS
jgi:hypothetical protein